MKPFKSSQHNDPPPTCTDILIVGAGIIGLAHAALAVRAGYSVTVLERDAQAVGASIRNFGHACITAQHGPMQELAQASRQHWLDFAEHAGFWAAPTGTIVVARSETELQLLREFQAQRHQGSIEILDRQEVIQQLGLQSESTVVGGAFLRDDLRVDPRTTVGKLAEWVNYQERGQVSFSTAASGFGPGTQRRHRVLTSRGAVEADQVFVCVGHDVDYLFPQLAEDHQITRCALQMASVRLETDQKITPAVLTATSMLRYDAFSHLPSYSQLVEQVAASSPHLLAIGANAMYTQRPDGTVLLGDSHSYATTHPPFQDEAITQDLFAELEQVLPQGHHTVHERWQGIYASSPRGPLLVKDIKPGLTVVSVTTGIGMTISFGLAETTLSTRAPALTHD